MVKYEVKDRFSSLAIHMKQISVDNMNKEVKRTQDELGVIAFVKILVAEPPFRN